LWFEFVMTIQRPIFVGRPIRVGPIAAARPMKTRIAHEICSGFGISPGSSTDDDRADTSDHLCNKIL